MLPAEVWQQRIIMFEKVYKPSYIYFGTGHLRHWRIVTTNTRTFITRIVDSETFTYLI